MILMRRLVAAAPIAILAITFYSTFRCLHGPNGLRGPVPVHFNMAGKPDAWGSPNSLWMLPLAALFLYLLMALVAKFPSAFNYPVRVTPANRPRLQAIALSMIAWLQLELVGLFGLIQAMVIGSVTRAAGLHGNSGLPPWLVPVSILVVFATIALHVMAMFRAAPPRRIGARPSDAKR